MKRTTRGALGFLISAAFIWWLVAKSGIHWHDAWLHVQQSNVWLLAASSLTATSIFAIRVPRWRIILGTAGASARFSDLWEAIAIGAMATNVFPLRAGEFARAFALTRLAPAVPFSTALGSVFVDRVFDGIVILLLLAVSVLDPAFPDDARINGIPVSQLVIAPLLALIVALVGVYALAIYPVRALVLYSAVARRIIPRFADRGGAFLERFANGLSVLQSGRRFTLVLFWTIAHWLVCAVSYWLAFRAFGIDAPFSAALFVQGIVVLAVAVPSSPGMVGPMEFGMIKGLNVYGVADDLAGAFAIAYHVITYIPITLFGLVYFLRLGLRFSDLKT